MCCCLTRARSCTGSHAPKKTVCEKMTTKRPVVVNTCQTMLNKWPSKALKLIPIPKTSQPNCATIYTNHSTIFFCKSASLSTPIDCPTGPCASIWTQARAINGARLWPRLLVSYQGRSGRSRPGLGRWFLEFSFWSRGYLLDIFGGSHPTLTNSKHEVCA